VSTDTDTYTTALEADLAFQETYYGGETRYTSITFGETADGDDHSVLVEQRWQTEDRPDVVGLTATRIETVRKMLREDAESREFEDKFGTEPVAGTTKVEVGEAAVVSQKLVGERVADVVTLTTTHLARIQNALKDDGGEADGE
jgi:hypothetical protein